MFAALALVAAMGVFIFAALSILVASPPPEMARERHQQGNMMDFTHLPHGDITLTNVTVPACLIGQEGDLVRTDISISNGRIAGPQPIGCDMKGAMVFPAFVDMHTASGQRAISGRAARTRTAASWGR